MTSNQEGGSVLTLAYCRVSTDEQVEEGFSIEGQADKLRAYSSLRDLGGLTVITDPGISGKDMKRPGLQQLLAAVEAGHVSHVLVWRLDRLSRNLGDLILLADKFGEHGVALHSVSENLDLSSASGRMFYNILGTFAQFFREQLSENVKMGNERAIKEGRHINRPKIGYSLTDGFLIPNDDAPRVREVFRLRAEGLSYRAIEEQTGIKESTVMSILRSRVYLGEVPHKDEWFPGIHEPIVTPEAFEAAQRGHVPGRRRAKDLLSGRVFCGLCDKRMSVETNGDGRTMYRCRNRGQGCDQPRRTNSGLILAALLGIDEVASNEELQVAIRRQLAGPGLADWRGSASRRPERRRAAETLSQLTVRRRKLLELHYAGNISAEGFAEEERRIAEQIEAARSEVDIQRQADSVGDDVARRFEEVVALLQLRNVSEIWDAATDPEKRVFIEELVEGVKVFPDHLEVMIIGAPSLNVTLEEVGLQSYNARVGGGV